MNNLFKKIIRKIGRDIITVITKCKKNRILFMQESWSGSNSYALWKLAGEDTKKKYEIILYQDSALDGKGFTHFIKKYRLISSAQLIVTTHASYKPSKRHIHLQLWHGVFVKKNGVMLDNKPDSVFKTQKDWLKVDYIMSYSETCNTFLNACMPTNSNKYIITGAPRNDFLFVSEGMSNVKKIFGEKIKDDKLVFFLPTFRDYYGKNQGNKNYNNPFGFVKFSPEGFDKFLEGNKCKIIFKPHPHEEALIISYFRDYPLKNMLILKDSDLVANSLDLYELLNASDMLITDYSSVFYDYLLFDKPIIFAPVDVDSYSAARGFLIESFENWAPGPKVFNQDTLQKEILYCLSEKDYYREKRAWMRNLHHRYKDGESSKRLWEFIERIL
ncbi:MAG: CDP-glycerol glycerophosphotransferase family protein [bacterium]